MQSVVDVGADVVTTAEPHQQCWSDKEPEVLEALDDMVAKKSGAGCNFAAASMDLN